jgi:hypothetical protein
VRKTNKHTTTQIPGLIHAWYVIIKNPDTNEYERVPQDYEGGRSHGGSERVTYVFVPAPHAQAQSQPQSQKQPKSGQQPKNYGTNATNNNAAAGSSSSAPSHHDDENTGNEHNNERSPPTYAEAVKGDHKVQTQD